MSAYHLKDELIADGAVNRKNVESAINHSPTLSLLADLANLDKHRKLKSPPRSGDVPIIISVSDASDGPRWKLVVSIRHRGALVDGVAFAGQAVNDWRLHLQSWSLL